MSSSNWHRNLGLSLQERPLCLPSILKQEAVGIPIDVVLSALLQKRGSFSVFTTASHADWLTISVAVWLIGLSGDRLGNGGGEEEDMGL